jgi:hypothetical protein
VEAGNPEYDMAKYREDQHLINAAHEVRLINTESAGAHRRLSRTFEYPGFRIFEVESEDG